MINDGAKFLTGQTVGPYEILNALGAGGMGEVYLAKGLVSPGLFRTGSRSSARG